MNLLSYILLLVVASVGCCHEASSDEPLIHQCINDKVQPSFDNMLHISEDSSSSRSSTKGKRPKRETNGGMENMRLYTVYHSSTADKSFFISPTGSFRKAANFFSKAFLVKPRKSRLTLQPKCSETITSGANAGKCKKVDKAGDMNCGPFSIPANLKGAEVECKKKGGSCKSKGSSGTGVNADFILFAGAMDSECALYGSSVLAFAAVCGVDDTNQRPSVGFINICYKNILNSVGSVNDDIVYNILLHEMSHAFGFTSTAMKTLFRNQQGIQYNPVSQFRFDGRFIPGLTSPKVLQYAREYYNCPSLKYMPLEDGGGSGSASSHWEARVLYHEMLMPFLSLDYMVFSNFTWAFFEDSGWYGVDYSYTNSINSLEMKWGKGLGCNFVTRPCADKTSFPYSCEAHGCTFDRISKGVCRSFSQFFDGCKIIFPQSSGSCIHSGKKLSKIDEVFGKTSRCFEYQSSAGSGSSLACLNTSVVHHPNSGVTAYKIESGSSSEWCEEGERELIDGHLVRCPVIEDITIQYTDIQSINTVPRQLCHSGCMDCTEPYESSQCTSCHTGFKLDGPTPNSCCNPQQPGSCKSISTCTNGEVRLVGGDSLYEGNVQTCVNGEWGSVCHNNWHTLEAFVVCKQLGYSLIGAKPTCCSRFRNVLRPPFVQDRLRCTGKESMLADCSYDNSQISRCNSVTIAGVQCPAPCKNGDTKIISYYGTDGFVNGRPSVCHESVFKPICDFGWDDETASLFCKEHGFSQYGVISSRGNTLYSSLIEATKSVFVTSCKGKSQFAKCQLGTTTNCPRSIAGVVCQPANMVADGCTHGDIRLVGGATSAEGRLEVCVNNIWGTVCGSYSWGANEATVACKQLGYSDGSVVSGSDFPFGRGSGPVLLNFVNCTGSKKKLIDCSNHYYSYCASPASVSCS